MLFIGPPIINLAAARMANPKRISLLEIAVGIVRTLVSLIVGLVAYVVIIIAALTAIGAGTLEIAYFFNLCKR